MSILESVMATKAKSEFFTRIADSITEGIAAEKAGKKLTRRTIEIPPRPKSMSATHIIRLRKKLRMSQGLSADFLNVSIQTVQAWEQGRTKPTSSALRLLQLADDRPDLFVDCITK